jgi:hypothetical protein
MRILQISEVAIALALMIIPANAEQEVSPPVAGKTVKVLTVGNSFAKDATTFLPQMAEAAGHDFLLFRANPGGCSMEKHAGWIAEHELDPESPKGRPYPADFSPERVDVSVGKMYSLAEILAAEEWDFVTIQQVSNLSFKEKSFEPYAETIINCIRENAPGAEIVIHQTLAYREDYPGFASGKFTQQKMFGGLESNYRKLAEKYALRVIPVGKAFQNARGLPRWTYTFPDPKYNYDAPDSYDKPVQTGSLNVGWMLQKFADGVPVEPKLNPETGEFESPVEGEITYKATLDFKHSNLEGQFLGSSVFYGFLFGEKVSGNTFPPPWIDSVDASALREIADRSLEEYKQVNTEPKE